MLKSIVRGAVIAAVLVAALSFWMPVLDTPVVAQDSGALQKVKDGLSKYKKGDYRGAIEDFDAALAAAPTDEEARKLRDEITERMAQDFINSNIADATLAGRYQRFGKWVLAGRKRTTAYPSRYKDAAQIKTFVEEYMNDQNRARQLERANQIRDVFGDFAVPEIYNYMKSDNQGFRYRAQTLLAHLGAQAVNPLIQLMYSKDTYVRQVAALALMDIADPRALPVLAKHFQKKDEDVQVKQACGEGIKRIRSAMPEKDVKVSDAKDLFYLQAEGYYRNNAAGGFFRNRLVGSTYSGQLPVLLTGYDRTYTVWKFVDLGEEGELLQDQEVPLWMFADLLAEESAIQALDVAIATLGGNATNNAFVQDTQALLSCIHFHIYVEGNARYNNGNDEERAKIVELIGEQGVATFFSGFGLGATSGSARLYLALQRSLADGYPEVSVAICDALAHMDWQDGVATKQGQALLAALTDPDKRIRYAAARTLIRLCRDKEYANAPLVEQVMSATFQESAVRSVLVISEDEALRNRLLKDLESLAINAVGARTLEEGARMAVQSPLFDAIIIQGELAMAPTFYWEPTKDAFDRETKNRMETIFDIIRGDLRTAGVPILIACKDGDKEARQATLAPKNIPGENFIAYSQEYSLDKDALGQVLNSIWTENMESAKSKTDQVIVLGAQALESLEPNLTKFNVRNLLTALAGGLKLEGRNSASRAAMCMAIAKLVKTGKIDAGWAKVNLVQPLLDRANSGEAVDNPEVKAAACAALGNIFGRHPGAFTTEAYNTLLALLRYEVNLVEITDLPAREKMIQRVAKTRTAAGVALGQCPLNEQQKLAVTKAQQVNPHRKHPDRRKAE